MNWPIALRIALISSICAGCAQKDNENEKRITNPDNSSRSLDVVAPWQFIDDNFRGSLPPEARDLSLDVDAIDEEGTVALVNMEKEVSFHHELITASQSRSFFSVGINSCPMNFNEVVTLSKRVCEVIGIKDENIKVWLESKRYEDAVDATCLQIGRIGEIEHSVEVRRSFNSSNPWRMIYEVTFTNGPDSQ